MIEQQIVFTGAEVTQHAKSRNEAPTLGDYKEYVIPRSDYYSLMTRAALPQEVSYGRLEYIPGRDDAVFLETKAGRVFKLLDAPDQIIPRFFECKDDLFVNLVTSVSTLKYKIPKIPLKQATVEDTKMDVLDL